MRWKTTISFLTLVFFSLLSLWLFHSSDETPQRSEADEARGENSSKEKKKAAAKLYHGTLPALVGNNRMYRGVGMLVSYYLPGTSLAQPPTPRE